ncbi:MAG: hypothetical protein E7269_01550 [Lachnospiraceae bacterium]|nr:hypothetical protein [Lachnospiraceae bacterium]
MSQEIWIELSSLGQAVLLGICLRVGYDAIRIIRSVIPHAKIIIAIEDFVYWTTISFFIFILLYRTNAGALRGIIILCVFLGMLLVAIIDKKVEECCRKPLKKMKKKVIMSLTCLRGGKRSGKKQEEHPAKDTKKRKICKNHKDR